jgi:hypothetical protein
MKGIIVKDWNRADLSSAEGSRKYLGAFNYFLRRSGQKPSGAGVAAGALREFTTGSDFPAAAAEAVQTFTEHQPADLGYESIFDIRDFTGSAANSFAINSVSSGLTFRAVPAGDKAQVAKLSGERTTVYFDRFGGAMLWDKTWWEDQDYWAIEDAALHFRNKWYETRATAFYTLIANLSSGVNESYDTDDVTTINNACKNIIDDCADSGYGIGPSTGFVVLCPLALYARLRKSLAELDMATESSESSIKFNVNLVVTANSAIETDKYYVCLPKYKAKGGYRQELTVLSATDVLAYAETVAGWGRYGGAVGDENQFRRCSIS